MPVTLFIMFITVATSALFMNNQTFKVQYMFNAYAIHHRREWYRFFTHGLLHGDWMHLIFNMYSLYLFGELTEKLYGIMFGPMKGYIYYAILYIGALFVSSVYSYARHKDNKYYNALGASGAVSAVVFAAILMAPSMEIWFFVKMPGWVYGLLYLAYSYYMARRGTDNIGHDAHFWGAVFGIGFTLVLKPELFSFFIRAITHSSDPIPVYE